MENATKALTMAAGILIALIIISLLVIMFTRISSVQKANLSNEEARQIAEFNGKYTKYKGKHVYGTEVVTVINRGIEDRITVIVTDKGGHNSTTYNSSTQHILTASAYSEKKYKCTNIEYDDSATGTGKVISISFQEI